MQEILKQLNDKQYEAVVNTEGPCLSNCRCRKWKKTKVLTHKIAYLILKRSFAMEYISNNFYK